MTELTDDATREEIEEMNERLVLINRLIRHDVRNDMATAHGWAEELRDHVDEDGDMVLDKVLDAVERTLDLTRVSRDFVRAAMTGPNVHIEPVELRAAISREVDRMREIDGSAAVEVGDIPDVEVLADDLLSSVFANVLENAFKHTERDDPHVTVGADRDGDTVTVRIADDGPGVPAEDREAVFGRSDRGLEDPAAGLGLHLVDGLVRGYGGDVWIEDNEPEGCAVLIELRVAEDAEEEWEDIDDVGGTGSPATSGDDDSHHAGAAHHDAGEVDHD